MRKGVKIIVLSLLLAVGVVICAVRWQAWFGMPAEPKWTGDTLHHEFVTFARDSVPGFACTSEGWQDTLTPESLDILVFGDIHNSLQREDYDSIAVRVPQADLVLQVGDWLDRGQEYYHQMLLREWDLTELSCLPIINCPGNHEYTKGLNKHLSSVWSETFPQPNNGPIGVPGKHYYVDFPQLRIIAIDTNPLVRLVHLTRTLTWLREAMYTAGDRYIVVMMHHPVFSAAKGRFNTLVYTTFRHALGEADLVLAGHDHSYMRRTPFVVLNTSGHPKTQQIPYATDTTFMDPVYGVLSIQQLPDSNIQSSISNLQFTVHRLEDGTVIDSLYVKHD